MRNAPDLPTASPRFTQVHHFGLPASPKADPDFGTSCSRRRCRFLLNIFGRQAGYGSNEPDGVVRCRISFLGARHLHATSTGFPHCRRFRFIVVPDEQLRRLAVDAGWCAGAREFSHRCQPELHYASRKPEDCSRTASVSQSANMVFRPCVPHQPLWSQA